MPASATNGPRAGFAAYYALGILMLGVFLSFTDRLVLSLLIPAVRHDLGISDTQVSMLIGGVLDGVAFRSRWRRRDRRGNALAWAGPRDRVRAGRLRMARGAVPQDTLRPGRQRPDRVRPGQFRRPQRADRQRRVAPRGRPGHRQGPALAAHMLEAAIADVVFADGRFTVAGTDRGLAFTEVSAAFFRPAHLPDGFDLGLDAVGTYAADSPSFPNGCHICELEVDPETGETRLDRYTVTDDVGRAINPMICEGQIHGGVAQGIGQALMEQVVYDREDGQLLTGSFQDYRMPRAADFPAFATGFSNVPSPSNPFGVKGVGESGTVGAPPAVIAAVLDALAPLGVTGIDMPATPQAIWRAIREAAKTAT